MAIGYRSAAGSNYVNDSVGNITIPKPSGVVDGDFLFAAVASYDGFPATPVITLPSGWNLIDILISQTSQRCTVTCWKIASSEPASWVWTTTGATQKDDGVVIALTGVATTTPIDVHGIQTEAGPTGSYTYSSPTVTSTLNNEWIINAYFWWANVVDDTTNYLPSGNTERYFQGSEVRWRIIISTRSFPTAGATGLDTLDSPTVNSGYTSMKSAVKPLTVPSNTGNFFTIL